MADAVGLKSRLMDYPGSSQAPIISLSPSMMRASSSGDARPIFLPMRSDERVRIWLILTQERLGDCRELSWRVSGNPARWAWLVMATAITVR